MFTSRTARARSTPDSQSNGSPAWPEDYLEEMIKRSRRRPKPKQTSIVQGTSIWAYVDQREGSLFDP